MANHVNLGNRKYYKIMMGEKMKKNYFVLDFYVFGTL